MWIFFAVSGFADIACHLSAWLVAYKLGLLLRRLARRALAAELLIWTYLLAGCGMTAQKALPDMHDWKEPLSFFFFGPMALFIWFVGTLSLTILWPFRWLGPEVAQSGFTLPHGIPTVQTWAVEELRHEMWLAVGVAVPLAALLAVRLRRRDRSSAEREVGAHQV